MKRRIFFFLLIFALLFAFTLSASAHSGGTDGKGGHWNHSTGEYHYHHGKPAHDHPNGVCPYDTENSNDSQDDGLSIWVGILICSALAWFIGYLCDKYLCQSKYGFFAWLYGIGCIGTIISLIVVIIKCNQ